MRATAKQRGFTLIELMIVVAIIGILAAIAIPNFNRFQNKAKQSEAKTNLKALYIGAKSRFLEKDDFGDATNQGVFAALGWVPEANNKYAYVFGSATYTINAADRTLGTGGTANACSVGTSTVSATNAAVKNFVAQACANLDGDAFIDTWMINDQNILFNGTITITTNVVPTVDDGNDAIY
jgi:type IV pilus assembly protein PilA